MFILGSFGFRLADRPFQGGSMTVLGAQLAVHPKTTCGHYYYLLLLVLTTTTTNTRSSRHSLILVFHCPHFFSCCSSPSSYRLITCWLAVPQRRNGSRRPCHAEACAPGYHRFSSSRSGKSQQRKRRPLLGYQPYLQSSKAAQQQSRLLIHGETRYPSHSSCPCSRNF